MPGLWLPRGWQRPFAGAPRLRNLSLPESWYVCGDQGVPVLDLGTGLYPPTLTGSPSLITDPDYGSVLRLVSASGQRIEASGSPVADTITSVTMATWLRIAVAPAVDQTIGGLVDINNSARRSTLELLAGGTLAFRQRNTVYNTGVACPTGQWVHVAAVVVGASYRAVHLDGALIFSDSTANSSHPLTAIRWGSNRDAGWLDADLLDARIYGRALSAGEVALWADPAALFDSWA